jgi:TolB-like protein/Tfp pilus assembly protein PilF
MSDSAKAVFLSYASQDAEAAQKICEALRAAGIEVWFDQSELRGGDAWDQSIRKQIKTCALFIPVISHATHDRREGYFRLEWKLAVDRSHLMDAEMAFLLPVVIDDTHDGDERVPERFREVQWSRLPDGQTSPAFIERVRRLLSSEVSTATEAPVSAVSAAAPGLRRPVRASRRSKPVLLAAVAIVVLAALAYLLANKFWILKHAMPETAARAGPTPTAFAPPPHSIAVLPFVNMSGDKEQEYFSDGLTEEILNSLARVNELQVAARTSSFSFQGEHPDIATVAHKLNVGAILEGSVRRSGNTVRITAQLINAVTGFHLWSETYDRDLGDVLKLQTDIANAVAGALKVSLLGQLAAKIELGGTHNPAALDAYLRGRKAYIARHDVKDVQTAIAAYTKAIGLDPNYGLAFANRSLALNVYAGETSGPEVRESFDKAQADALKAIALAPDLAEGHLALAAYFDSGLLDFIRANEEYERALALEPGNSRIMGNYGAFAVLMGRTEAGITAARRALALDPLNRANAGSLGAVLLIARQYDKALAAYLDALALDPEWPALYASRGLAYYLLGDFERARASCESKPDYFVSQQCLAVTYDKLGRHSDAEAELAKLKAALGDAAAYQYAEIYAQFGNRAKALEWLETALRLRDPGLVNLKTDPLMDPLRQEPRFQAVMRELKFPT